MVGDDFRRIFSCFGDYEASSSSSSLFWRTPVLAHLIPLQWGIWGWSSELNLYLVQSHHKFYVLFYSTWKDCNLSRVILKISIKFSHISGSLTFVFTGTHWKSQCPVLKAACSHRKFNWPGFTASLSNRKSHWPALTAACSIRKSHWSVITSLVLNRTFTSRSLQPLKGPCSH